MEEPVIQEQPPEITKMIHGVFNVYQLLLKDTLAIPEYQRPYKWTVKHISQLFSDIALHKDKPAYRLGTIVFHNNMERRTWDIVDGQQRTITLILAVRALIELRLKYIKWEGLRNKLEELSSVMADPSFPSQISKFNICNNYQEISRIVVRPEFTDELIYFLLNKCQFVYFVLNDLSEAFQFFDSQNARGRDLDPHDLLKAYHLREFGLVDANLKANTVARWENSETEELAALFSEYLYRIRKWSRGQSGRYFSKDEIGLFKGINIETVAHYPYVDQLRIAHQFVDHYNQQYERKVDGQEWKFPFHLDQIIINGRRFFEMVTHYQEQISKFDCDTDGRIKWLESQQLDGFAKEIIKTINTYEGRNRPGDGYLRTLFDCLMLYYIDKFGRVEISRAIEKIFIFAYSLRFQNKSIHLASMDNYVLKNNLFTLIRDATLPGELINFTLQPTPDESKKTKGLSELFNEMGYLCQ